MASCRAGGHSDTTEPFVATPVVCKRPPPAGIVVGYYGKIKMHCDIVVDQRFGFVIGICKHLEMCLIGTEGAVW